MNATLISIINVFRNRGLRTLDHEGAESSVDLSTMLQWTVITIGLICGWKMPLGHDLILLTQMHGNAPVGVGLNFWVHSNDRTTTERSPHFPTEVFFRSGKRPYHSIDLM